MRAVVIIVLLIAASIAAAPAALPPIGVASVGVDRSCALIEGPAVPAGSEVTIVVGVEPGGDLDLPGPN